MQAGKATDVWKLGAALQKRERRALLMYAPWEQVGLRKERVLPEWKTGSGGSMLGRY